MITLLAPTIVNKEAEIRRLLDSLGKQTYDNFELIFVSQGNHNLLSAIIKEYPKLRIKHIKSDVLGLSYNRNIGLKHASGDIIILSDDDCWYHERSLEIVENLFENNNNDIILTKIFDPIREIDYKKYPEEENINLSKINCLSKSSIELAFKNKKDMTPFDVNFGLGAKFKAAEEVDFLLANFENNKIGYFPIVTVFHEKKSSITSNVYAKGALYSKHFNMFLGVIILFRDLIIKKENNFNEFKKGFTDYKSLKKGK